MKKLILIMSLVCAAQSAQAFEAVRTGQFVFYAQPVDRAAAE